MPKYDKHEVTVLITNEPVEKTITVYAEDQEIAADKAGETVSGWESVDSVEVEDVRKVEG